MKTEDNYRTLLENAEDSEVNSAELNDYREVINRLYHFGENENGDDGKERYGYFNDMLFREGGSTFHLLDYKDENGDDVSYPLPVELEYFDYNWFSYKINDNCKRRRDLLPMACFNRKDQLLIVSRDYINDDRVVLHEMIHLHEFVIDELSPFYRDVLFMQLYNDLRYGCPETQNKCVEGLDDVLKYYSLFANQHQIKSDGGNHSLLFLLKSMKLDIQMGYELGTIAGYEYIMKDIFTDKIRVV